MSEKGSAWGGVPATPDPDPRQKFLDQRSPMDRNALEQAMVLAGRRGSQEQHAVTFGDLDRVTGQMIQQYQVPIREISGLIADPALLFRNAGLSAPEIVDALPATDNFVGRLVFLTTDNKLYRYTGDGVGEGWKRDVEAVDVIGTLTDAQIASISAAKVSGQLTDAQIASIATAKLTGQITSTQITDNAITTAKINAGAITASEIAAGAVVADKIGANAVTAGKISAGAVEAGNIAAGAVVSDSIAANAITAVKIAAGTITGDKISANTITGDRITANTITGGLLATSGIITQAAQIGTAVIQTAAIANSAITNALIQNGAITNAKIGNLAVDTANIANGAITNAKISGAIQSTNYSSSAGWLIDKNGNAVFNTLTLRNGIIGTGPLDDLAVTLAKLASNSVSTPKIVNNAVSDGASAYGATNQSTNSGSYSNILSISFSGAFGSNVVIGAWVRGQGGGGEISAFPLYRILFNGSVALSGRGNIEQSDSSYLRSVTASSGTNTVALQMASSESGIPVSASEYTLYAIQLKK